MKILAIILLAITAGSLAVRAELPSDWSTNYTAVLSAAKAEQGPVLVFFTASWCGPCKLMTRVTLADPGVVQVLTKLEHVAVDIDEHSDFASKSGIEAVPTFLLLAGGQEVNRTTGFQKADSFLSWLTNGLKEAQTTVVHQTHTQSQLSEVDQLLTSTETNSTRLAAAKLFDLCAEHDETVVKAAANDLRTLAARDPVAVLSGLNDPHLATRIQAANALRETIGISFNVDPWGDVATRQNAVIAWQEKLANASSLKRPQ